MEEISNKSCFIRIKERLAQSSKLLLIDESGELNQKEAFDIYIGAMNELSSLVKENDVCLFLPYLKKETVLILSALVSIGACIVVGDPKNPLDNQLPFIKEKTNIDATVFWQDGKWIIEKGSNSLTLSLTPQKLKVKPREIASKEKPSFLVLTSGSSGINNVVALSEYSLVNHVVRQMNDIDFTNGCTYSCVPMNHVLGLAIYLHHLLLGKQIFISNSRNPLLALDTIEKYKCTSISNVPTFFYMLIEAQEKNPHDISSLKYGVIAGGGYTKEQFLNIEKKLGISLCSSYGMTEASTVITDSPASWPIEDRCIGVGKPFPDVDVVFKDDNNNIEPLKGEICFKGYNLMLGYLEKDGLHLPLDEDGYFHTGDIGMIDDHGIYHIVDRKKNIIIRGGENLSPIAIQNKIITIDGIKDACVVGIPNKKYGEVVGAYLVSDVYKTLEEVKPLLSKVLLKNENPTILIIDSKMPLLSNGKHDRMLIKSILAKENA